MKTDYNGSVFHSQEFNKIISEVLGRKVNFVCNQDNFYITHPDKKLKLLKINYCPDPRLECVYGGILGEKQNLNLKGLWHITTLPGEDISEYLKKGFYAKERFTSILSLDKSEKELWDNLNVKTRRYTRKGIKNDIKIIKSKNIDEYYGILKETYEKAGLKLLPKEYYEEILNKLGELFLAEYDNKIIAGAILLKYEDKTYFWNGGSKIDYSHLFPNDLVHWNLIKWSKENGFKEYDLLGLDVPSIARFKEGLGGERVKFYTLYSKSLYLIRKIKNLF